MGRDAGWLTASAALGRLAGLPSPDLVYLPERDFNMEEFFEDLQAAMEKKPNIVVAVSEGLRFADGRYVGESTQGGAVDAFGHKYLAGTGKALELAIKDRLGCKVRSVELNLPQRCSAHMLSKTDIDESVLLGKSAVSFAEDGKSGVMLIYKRLEGDYGIEIDTVKIGQVANQVKHVPDSYINAEGNNITTACMEYIAPLILGEREIRYENGLPVHLELR